jgi:excinuclease UvrABC ATPase subunit
MAEFEKAHIAGMCSHCRGNSIEKAWENSHVFDEEDRLVSEGADELIRWMNTL